MTHRNAGVAIMPAWHDSGHSLTLQLRRLYHGTDVLVVTGRVKENLIGAVRFYFTAIKGEYGI